MTKIITITALAMLAGAAAALAQGTSGAPVIVQPGTAFSPDVKPSGVPALRQRQPRRGDLPAADREPGGINYIDPQDAELDRKIRNICRGC